MIKKLIIILLSILIICVCVLIYKLDATYRSLGPVINDVKAKMAQVDKAVKQVNEMTDKAKRIMESGENKLNELNGEIGAQRKEFEGLKKAVSLIGVGK